MCVALLHRVGIDKCSFINEWSVVYNNKVNCENCCIYKWIDFIFINMKLINGVLGKRRGEGVIVPIEGSNVFIFDLSLDNGKRACD